ncbi:MAG: hypothetical protein KKH41_01965 [Candidatus Thermoplasmatota archaeon]|nr:hypothetical protein [Candidatus Thermoplasmatota archaeon]MBU4071877.1 hypothetical protein [Candidatus Thermoplasmatota archaeon]MBU4144378.1 hypothetical protein [Candidatus Thermoplasmatota archaeon]MBU4591327.1 hypothetical protein [Candidatus Thermoplasmatota archaeon]
MVKKKVNEKPRADEKCNEEKKNASGENMEDIMNIWMEQQLDMFNQMNKAIDAQQKQYMNIGKNWATFNASVHENVSKDIGDNDYRELANLWKEQYAKINTNLLETTRKNINQYAELFDKWSVFTDIMNKVASSRGEEQKNHLQNLATMYEDLPKYTADLFEKDNAAMAREYNSIESTWMEFTKKMNEILAKQATNEI